MSQDALIPIGTVFRGRYEVASVLGSGGVGNTYVVLDHERFKRKCVLKELLPKHAGKEKIQELFEREARTLDRLNHHGIPRLEAFFEHHGHYYLVEQFVGGETLAEVVEKRGALPVAEVVQIATAILEILGYLHSLKPPVVHRDIKPSNLMVTEDGRYQLIDFGAVREALQLSAVDASDHTTIGTPGYMPPEQFRGQAYPASDLYALGATLLHLVTGRPPTFWYNARDGVWTFDRALSGTPALAQILKKMLADLLPDRYGSAAEVARDLTALQSPRDQLIRILRREGADLIDDAARCESHLRVIGGEQGRLLIAALRDGVPRALAESPSEMSSQAHSARLAEALHAKHGVSAELAQWAVESWRRALLSAGQEDTVIGQNRSRSDPAPPAKPQYWKWLAGGAGILALLFLLFSGGNSIEVESVKFFTAADGLKGQLTDTLPNRNYRSQFRSNEPQYIYYDLRLAQPAPADMVVDIKWLKPDGKLVTQDMGIKSGSRGITFGWGFRQAPFAWNVGRWVVEFSSGGKKLAAGEFTIVPGPPPKLPPFNTNPLFVPQDPFKRYDIPALKIDVQGSLRFFDGPKQVPPVGARSYRTQFDAAAARQIRCEIGLKNAGNLAPQKFKIMTVWTRDRNVIHRGEFETTTPGPQQTQLYSYWTGDERPGTWVRGAYTVQVYVHGTLVRTGTFSVW